ncbi:MAG TPA: Gfo/Idh/MocA family oxidoreductase [Ktedonobacterales bacterium]|nr:Gfo/Idh/MocA family oxidoreductase [Ktedonobacterales bacterium]
MEKVRWGVLSTSALALKQVIPAMQQGHYSEIAAIASRNLEAAQEATAKLGIAKAYGSYEALLADPDIDAIYNPLPNHLHVPWSIKALEAGKHVLCEKPVAMTAAEAQTLADAGKAHPHLKLTEAFMYRYHPQWQRAKQLVAEGGIGELRTIQTLFSYYNDDPNNIRNIADVGGGAMMDIGCYAVSVPRFIFGAEPSRVSAIVEYDPRFKTDRLASAVLDFGTGTAIFTCGTQLAPYQRVNILGTQGCIEIEIPFNAPKDRPCKVWYEHGGQVDEILLDICNQYTLQGDAVSQAILNETPVPTPIEDAVANMQVIEAVLHSMRQGSWETVLPN